jgi:hypothetical protein
MELWRLGGRAIDEEVVDSIGRWLVMRRLEILPVALMILACGSEAPETLYPELGLTCPCEIQRWESYTDGGSMGGTIRDSKGRVLKICWDGRMRLDSSPGAQSPRLAYINAEYPTDAGAIPLPVGSDAETELIALFDGWSSTQIPADSLDRWLGIYFDASIPVEDRLSQLPGLTEKEERALYVAATSRRLKRQREIVHTPVPESS